MDDETLFQRSSRTRCRCDAIRGELRPVVARFAIAPPSVVKWTQRAARTGSVARAQAALRHDRIDAPWVLDGPVNGDIFRTHVECVLAPTLQPGNVVVMDNPGRHKSPAIRPAIGSAKAHLLFLAPCNPDLNPIEQAFAKLKHWMRKAGPRSRDATWRTVGTIIDRFTPVERANCFEKRRLRFHENPSRSNVGRRGGGGFHLGCDRMARWGLIAAGALWSAGWSTD